MSFFQFPSAILILLVFTQPSVITNYNEIGSGEYHEREIASVKPRMHQIGRIQE